MDTMDRFDRLAALQDSAGFARGFNDRFEAGRALAQRLQQYKDRKDSVVLALPRGGVPVAYEIALTLDLPLDIFVVKKITLPDYEEMAIGAAASEGLYMLDEDLIRRLNLSRHELDQMAAIAHEEVERRETMYRNHRPAPHIEGANAILVDDGVATGSSMRVAVTALQRKNPARVIVAVPVASNEAAVDIASVADEVVCAQTPDPFYAVGLWYNDFSQTNDEEVRDLLERAASRYTAAS